MGDKQPAVNNAKSPINVPVMLPSEDHNEPITFTD